MTAVIGYIKNKKIWLAGDSYCSIPTRRDLCKSSKVYKIGSIGIGLCGMVRQELILEKTLRKAVEFDKVSVSHEWLKFELPDLLFNEMKEKGAIVEEHGQLTMGSSNYMIAFDGVIYYLGEDFGIWDSQRNIMGIGAGKEYALGALQGILEENPLIEPEEAMRKALKITSLWSDVVSEPFNCICIE